MVRDIPEPHPTLQHSLQNMPIMSNFSSTDKITFWSWRREALAGLGLSGMPRDKWAEVLLQHISLPALHQVAGTSEGDINRIPDDLRYHYGDPHTIMATLFRCHIALGPIPNPIIYKQAALSQAKLHSQVLASSAALLHCVDTPGASKNVYSCPMN